MNRRCAAEFIGTFAIVFFGCGSMVTLHGLPFAHLAVNSVFGLIVASMIYTLGHISGAHFNPAVTLGFASVGRFSNREVVGYILSQFAGAVIAALLLSQLFIGSPAANFGATIPTVNWISAGSLEFTISAFLMFVIISVATDVRAHKAIPGIAIGGYVMLAGLFAGPITGSSMNPARSLGPALFATAGLASLPLFFVFPTLGAVAAARLYEWIRVDTANPAGGEAH